MKEQYIPMQDVKKGIKITGNLMVNMWEGVRPTVELVAQKQAVKVARVLRGNRRTF